MSPIFIQIVVFAIFIIIVLAIFASLRPIREKFENSVNFNIISNRLKYVDYGLVNYFSQDSQKTRIKNGDTANNGTPYVFIYPNNIDIMCQATTLTDEFVCSDMNIGKSFMTDESPIYMNETKSIVISSFVKQSSDINCTMRIFNNEYKLMKRSILLDIISVEPLMNNSTNSEAWFRIKVSGNVSNLILTRPVFMSINELGAFTIIYKKVSNDGESNMFVEYNSTKEFQYFYVKKIEDLKVFPFTTNTINDRTISGKVVKVISNQTPITIYYPVFEKPLPFVNFDVNSFTIHLSKDKLERKKIIPTFITIAAGNENPSTDKITSIEIAKADTNKNDLLYKVTINHQLTTTTLFMPPDFVPQKYTAYDIMITYSFDIVIIAIFARDNTNREYCFVNRHADEQRNLIFESKKMLLETQLTPINDDSVVDTAIQHLPRVAFNLGYTFPN